MTKPKARVIAFYLPQFHPIPENNSWWGKGFTEWTNVAKAKPLFFGHYQPHIPADLGFYDLRSPETRLAQAEMARGHGIEGFCYWHYWFAGERLLERPFNEVLKTGEPGFPFCLAWANESWTGIWHGAPGRILKAQTYPSFHDHRAHFHTLLEAFSDERYLTVEGRPMLVIYRPREIPETKQVTDFWRDLALEAGLKGLHLVAYMTANDIKQWQPNDNGFDAAVVSNEARIITESASGTSFVRRIRRRLRRSRKFRALYTWIGRPIEVYRYANALPYFVHQERLEFEYYPCIIPNWDNTPRSRLNGFVLHNSTPELFRIQTRIAQKRVESLPDDHRIIFVKSWNEWAESNHLEPDLKFGRRYLEALRDELMPGQADDE
jgi:hypothetical protein